MRFGGGHPRCGSQVAEHLWTRRLGQRLQYPRPYLNGLNDLLCFGSSRRHGRVDDVSYWNYD